MKFIKQALMVVISAMAITACVKVNVDDEDGTGVIPGGSDDPNETKVLTGTIDNSITLKKRNFYFERICLCKQRGHSDY